MCVSFVAMVVVSLSYVYPYLFAFLFVLVVQWMQSPGKMTNTVTVDNVLPGTVTDTVEELWRPKKELWSLGEKFLAPMRAQACLVPTQGS